MESSIQSAYQEELLKLEQTTAVLNERLQKLQLIPRYYGIDITEQALDAMREAARRNLETVSGEPYFGRLDYEETGKQRPSPLYIGKKGIEDESTGELLVIDWRAPVASLFYSFIGGEDKAFYDSPDGIIEGIVYLKRNLVIRKQTLHRVVDAYMRGSDNLNVADEFLLYRLGENKDNRLRDIVSTIQVEQDRIIRSARNAALIIQGVAGSGKTTVALHRLAYLLYHYREQIRAERMIIFAPNSMFLDYISGVLPELGVGNIQQTTFSDWAMGFLAHEISLANSSEHMEHWFSIESNKPEITDEAPGRYKGSAAFLKFIEECFNRYEASFVPNLDFSPWEGVILSTETVCQWFYAEYQHYPLTKRRDRVQARIKRWIEIELNTISDDQLNKERKKKAGQRLKTYLKAWPDFTPFTFYKQLFNQDKPANFIPAQSLKRIPKQICIASNRSFKNKEVQLEDLAPLLYIKDRMDGIEQGASFDHVVIDEAQDFSPLQVALLKLHNKGNSFTILGDLSQGIHAYRGIMDWKEFLELFDVEHSSYFKLERSYRSTMEIIQFANAVLSRGNVTNTLAIPIFRSGEKVKIMSIESENRIAMAIKVVRSLQSGSANSIAVICRTGQESKKLNDELEKAGLQATLIEANQSKYSGGLSVLPVYLAKGLEFDAVLLMDVNERYYALTEQDAKLLYVGCTRALHELWVLYSSTASPLIELQNSEYASLEPGL